MCARGWIHSPISHYSRRAPRAGYASEDRDKVPSHESRLHLMSSKGYEIGAWAPGNQTGSMIYQYTICCNRMDSYTAHTAAPRVRVHCPYPLKRTQPLGHADHSVKLLSVSIPLRAWISLKVFIQLLIRRTLPVKRRLFSVPAREHADHSVKLVSISIPLRASISLKVSIQLLTRRTLPVKRRLWFGVPIQLGVPFLLSVSNLPCIIQTSI